MKQYFSFDVFDTCVTRDYPRPVDLFYAIGETLGYSPTASVEIARCRVEAQKKKQKTPDREEITFPEIYEQFAQICSFPADQIAQQELILEAQSLQPILATQQYIQQLREAGHSILFISDMYLPQSFIREILLKLEIAQPEEPIYVSGDIGVRKRGGKLFQYVLEQEGIQPRQLHHYGDNIQTDVLAPRKFGIKATHFQESELNLWEKRVMTKSFFPLPVKSKIAGISQAIRLRHEDNSEEVRSLVQLTTNLVAPLLVSYLSWVIQNAQKNGIQGLYFPSEDGELLRRIAQQLLPENSSLTCYPLHLSSSILQFATVTELTAELLDQVIKQGNYSTPQELLRFFQLSPVEIRSLLVHSKLSPEFLTQKLDPTNLETMTSLIQDQTIKEMILKNAQSCRQSLREYFDQEKLCQNNPWAIVHLHPSSSIQDLLSEVLPEAETKEQLSGYYLTLNSKPFPQKQLGAYQSFLISDLAIGKTQSHLRTLRHHLSIIEDLIRGINPTEFMGYQKQNEKVIPLLKSVSNPQLAKELIDKIETILIQYAQKIAQDQTLSQSGEYLKQYACDNLIDFLKAPPPSQVLILKKLFFDPQELPVKSTVKVNPLSFKELIQYGVKSTKASRQLGNTQRKQWLEGSVALSNPLIKLLFKLLTGAKNYVYETQPLWLYDLKSRLSRK